MEWLGAMRLRILADHEVHADPVGAHALQILRRSRPGRCAGLCKEQDVIASSLALAAPGTIEFARREDRPRMPALEGLEPRFVGAFRPVCEAAGLAGQDRIERGGELPP